MNKSQKGRIETLLKNYDQLKTEIKNKLLDEYPLTGVSYEGVFTGKTNDFFSRVEEYVLDKDKQPEELNKLLRKKARIDNCINSLKSWQYDLMTDYYWEGKTQEQLADGRMYGSHCTYNARTIRNWINDILEKLYERGILNNRK